MDRVEKSSMEWPDPAEFAVEVTTLEREQTVMLAQIRSLEFVVEELQNDVRRLQDLIFDLQRNLQGHA
jgi:hypothetical protein